MVAGGAAGMIPEGKQRVWEAIRSRPGLNQAAIVAWVSERVGRRVSQGWVYHQCQALLGEGRIRVERRGNQNAYFPVEAGEEGRPGLVYQVQEVAGELQVVSYQVGGSVVRLERPMPLAKLPEFHRDLGKYRAFLTG